MKVDALRRSLEAPDGAAITLAGCELPLDKTLQWLGDEEDCVSAGRWDDMPGIV